MGFGLPRGMSRRWWKLRAVDLLARFLPAPGRRRGAVVVLLDDLGGVVQARRALDYYPEALGLEPRDITIVGRSDWQSVGQKLFAGHPTLFVDEQRLVRKPFYRLRMLRALRRRRADIALLPVTRRDPLAADSLLWATGAPKRLAVRPAAEKLSPEQAWYLDKAHRVVETGQAPTHGVIRHYRFVSAMMGRNLTPEPPRLNWRDAAPPLSSPAPYVVLCFGANDPARRWPFENFVEIARRLLEWNFQAVFVGGPAERAFEAELRRRLDQPGVVNLIGRLSLEQLFNLTRNAAAVLTNENVTAHVAVALGTPTLVVAGGGRFGCDVPYPPEASPACLRFVFREMECFGCGWSCYRRQPGQNTYPCVAGLHEDTVWEEFKPLLTGVTEPAAAAPPRPEALD